MPLWLLALQFAGCAAAIGYAGYALSASADALADAYGWSRGWVGLALLATVTSLPELASGISAVAAVEAPNLAVGNALGACVFNVAFLVVVDLVHQRAPMYRQASATHILSAAFGAVMLGFVALSLLTAERSPSLLHVGVYSPLLLALYLVALRSVRSHERAAHAAATAMGLDHVGKRRLWTRFAVAASVVLAAGVWLPYVGDALASALGLSRSFVGTVLMAFVTTLPEMAVTLAAVRLGALDLGLGNVLGSNLFNVAILAVDDAFYVRGPLLVAASPAHAVTAVIGAVMCALVIIGLALRPHSAVLRTASWVSVALAVAYLVNALLLFLLGT